MNEQTAAASLSGNTGTLPVQRVATIDILRALTMVLMIFVNDLWSLTGIPGWLEHVEKGVDGMGLADTVFPAFLFMTFAHFLISLLPPPSPQTQHRQRIEMAPGRQ